MLCELGKNRLGAVAGMNRNIGVDEISQDRATPLIPPVQRNIDRLPFFDARGFWHAAQGGHRILQTAAGGKNRDDVTQSRNFKIDVGIRIGKLGRDANRLTVAGFKRTGSRHRTLFQDQINALGHEGGVANWYVNPCIDGARDHTSDADIDAELTAPSRSAEFLRASVAARHGDPR